MSRKKKSAILDESHRPINMGFQHAGLKEYMRMHDVMRKEKLSQVPFFKSRLGRQDFCVVTGSESRRFYVWYDRKEGWLIYVHNHGGIQFCVLHPCDLGVKPEYDRWSKFLKRILSPEERKRVRRRARADYIQELEGIEARQRARGY
jgi:hypothetical protein